MRRRIATLTGALLVAGVLSAFVPAASAQVGYPPGPCPPANTVVDAGAHAIGSTFSVHLVPPCVWDPGSAVSITVNNQAAGTKVAEADGGVTINITVVSATQLSINGVLVNGQCGPNQAVATGRSSIANGATESVTANFRVICPAAPAAASTVGGVAFTGANILKWGGIAAVLMIAGWLLVGVSRRRRTNPSN